MPDGEDETSEIADIDEAFDVFDHNATGDSDAGNGDVADNGATRGGPADGISAPDAATLVDTGAMAKSDAASDGNVNVAGDGAENFDALDDVAKDMTDANIDTEADAAMDAFDAVNLDAADINIDSALELDAPKGDPTDSTEIVADVSDSDPNIDATPTDTASTDTADDNLVCRGLHVISDFAAGPEMGPLLYCAPGGTACCLSYHASAPCGWSACCSDGKNLPGAYLTDYNWTCAAKLQVPDDAAKSCLTDTVPWTKCTEFKPLIEQGKIPFGWCSVQTCCPLVPGCAPTPTTKITPVPTPGTVQASAVCSQKPIKIWWKASTDSVHVYCKPDDSDCCMMLQPYAGDGPCGWDACCEPPPLQPKGLNWSNISCADLATSPQPYCVKDGTRRYRVCNPMQNKSAADIQKMPQCGDAFTEATTCCGKVVPACEGKPVQPMPPGP